MADMADGINPNDSKRQFRAASVKLSEVFQRFLEQRDLKDTTLRGYQQLMKCYLADWQQKRMADISEDMVYKRHQKLSQSSSNASIWLADSPRVVKSISSTACPA